MAGETKLYLYDADDSCMAGTATDFVVEDPKRHAREGVRSPGDIVKALGKYSNLKWVIVDSHGKSGELALRVPFTTSNAPLLARAAPRWPRTLESFSPDAALRMGRPVGTFSLPSETRGSFE